MYCSGKSNRVWLNFFLLLLCPLVLLACGGGAESKNSPAPEEERSTLPDWVSNPPRQQGVVYGVGSARIYANNTSSALQNAREMARVELVKELKVKVSGETTASFSRSIEDDKVSELTRSVVNEAKSEVEEVEISGIEFVRTEVMQSRNQVYVLSRLDTEKAAARIESRIGSLDKRLKEFEEGSQKSGKKKLQRLRKLLPVLALLEERGRLVDKLHMLEPDSLEPMMRQGHRELKDRIVTLLENITIGLKPQGKKTEELNSVLMQSLLEKGFNVRKSESVDLVLQYRTDFRSVCRDGSCFVFADGSASLLNSDKDVVAEFKARAKGASVEKALARDRALSKLADKLGENIGKSILQKL